MHPLTPTILSVFLSLLLPIVHAYLSVGLTRQSQPLSWLHALRRRDPFQQDLDRNLLSGYYADSALGTPAQGVNLLIDTCAPDIWVTYTQSPHCLLPSTPCNFSQYDNASSSTYVALDSQFAISFSDGTGIEGVYANETLLIGPRDDYINVFNGTFGFGLGGDSTRATLGLGFAPYGSSNVNMPKILEVLVRRGIISTHSFSLFLASTDTAGTLIFGGVDEGAFVGGLEGVKILATVDPLESYAVEVTRVVVSGLPDIGVPVVANGTNGTNTTTTRMEPQAPVTAFTGSVPVLLDSASTLLTLPQGAVTSIASAINATLYPALNAYILPCPSPSTSITLSFTFAHATTFNVSLPELCTPIPNGTTLGDGQCALLLAAPSATLGTARLGIPFLRSVYAVFDLDGLQVLLGQANFAQEVVNITEYDSSLWVGAPSASVSVTGVGVGGATQLGSQVCGSDEYPWVIVENDDEREKLRAWEVEGKDTAASTGDSIKLGLMKYFAPVNAARSLRDEWHGSRQTMGLVNTLLNSTTYASKSWNSATPNPRQVYPWFKAKGQTLDRAIMIGDRCDCRTVGNRILDSGGHNFLSCGNAPPRYGSSDGCSGGKDPMEIDAVCFNKGYRKPFVRGNASQGSVTTVDALVIMLETQHQQQHESEHKEADGKRSRSVGWGIPTDQKEGDVLVMRAVELEQKDMATGAIENTEDTDIVTQAPGIAPTIPTVDQVEAPWKNSSRDELIWKGVSNRLAEKGLCDNEDHMKANTRRRGQNDGSQENPPCVGISNCTPGVMILDTGAEMYMLSRGYAEKARIKSCAIQPMPVRTATTTTNDEKQFVSEVTEAVQLQFGNIRIPQAFYVTDAEHYDMLVGAPFFAKFNPTFDWANQTVTLSDGSRSDTLPQFDEDSDPEEEHPIEIDMIGHS
ncbi:acid protease [Saitoella complicata NRRL Y-17804]|uniref:acid protease n=1 Tax=Saitoella complicata (strain BCRC 22490 / CBS 7301 / JCM 7358 / NBRC 10748 / NRRL Y-17804) TaxID=698492 RepID=UPI0008668448|nr:acid protease [Saitoella complicata NRRL Y-17804]ODQ54871.1 acid protease [Saitoella complicata NRRL Y-17804]